MPVTHTNRRGDLYYLHVGKTRTGKPKYHFSRSADGELVPEISAGYEIYENPGGQVFLRKELKSRIREEEMERCRGGIERHSKLKLHQFLLNRRKDEIEVYLLDRDYSALGLLLGTKAKMAAAEMARRHGNYTAMLRFILLGEIDRFFVAERFCFRGGVDDWIFIGGPAPLDEVVAEFAPHLGQQSFYELG